MTCRRGPTTLLPRSLFKEVRGCERLKKGSLRATDVLFWVRLEEDGGVIETACRCLSCVKGVPDLPEVGVCALLHVYSKLPSASRQVPLRLFASESVLFLCDLDL